VLHICPVTTRIIVPSGTQGQVSQRIFLGSDELLDLNRQVERLCEMCVSDLDCDQELAPRALMEELDLDDWVKDSLLKVWVSRLHITVV
jgi:hypothetical protein